MTRHEEIAAALEATRARIADAERAGGRPTGAVRLIAVSKRMPVADLQAAFAAGQRDFGENYAQELREKRAALSDADVRWHFIGPLQSNKVKILGGQVAVIHTVDAPELVAMISKRTASTSVATSAAPGPQTIPQQCLVQVNLAGAERQSGVAPEELGALLDAFAGCPGATCVGLMLIPPQAAAAHPDLARHHFATLRALAERERRVSRPNVDLRELSMGMSHDFLSAIAEGATMVRVGTAIFGARPR